MVALFVPFWIFKKFNKLLDKCNLYNSLMRVMVHNALPPWKHETTYPGDTPFTWLSGALGDQLLTIS